MSPSSRILVVGNDAAEQRAQRDMLATAELDWELDFSDSGQDALAKISALQPDCVILDYRLPDMSGLECFQEIHARVGATVPVLLLIGPNDEPTVVEALRIGVQDYLFKDARGNYLALLPAVLKKALREQQTAEEKDTALQESEARFRGAFDSAPIGMALVGLDGRWLRVNQSLCGIVGYTENELSTMLFQDITHPDDLDIDQTFAQLLLADQLKTYQMETRYVHKDERIVPVMLSSSLVRNDAGKPLYFITKIEDITQRKKMEDALFAEKDLAQTTLQSIGDAVITTDVDGKVTYLNPMAERLTGWTNLQACGLPFDHVFVSVDETTREVAESPVRNVLAEGKICWVASNTVLISRNGLEYYIDSSAAPIRVRNGGLTGVVMVFHDVTEARSLSRKISFQASHDALTGLCNRSEFELVAARLLQLARTERMQHTLLYLDLDQFKIVNDTCGHLAGDQLLRQLSSLLTSNMRKSDTLARLGGDEFGILLEGCPPQRAMEIAQHLIDMVRAFRFDWEGKLFGVGVSIGLVAINEQSKDLQSLLSAADTACYFAKNRGRNCVQVFEYGNQQIRERHVQIDWVARLQKALEQDRFSLYCQMVMPLADPRAATHHEVLLRYQDEQGRLLLPMAFIPAAERYGLLPAIDRWVIRQLLANPPQVLFDGNPGSFIAINISGSSLADPDFHDFVVHELHASGLPPGRICFEIAEAAAITNLHRAMQFIQTLRALGCRSALDDFGSGLSSFSYLKSLPVDFLKIDGSIVKGIAKNAIDCAMVESIHRIAQAMGIHSIAKFVESEEILVALRRIGIDYAQGFVLHAPELIRPPGMREV